MTQLDLASLDPKVAITRIVWACETFICEEVDSWLQNIVVHLKTAEGLAEQILGHFGSLEQASKALKPVCWQNDKLPEQVLRTLLFACVREHPLLEVIMTELHELYAGEKRSNEYTLIQSFMNDDRRIVTVTKPQMIDKEGVLKHSPDAFQMIHPAAFHTQITARLRGGAPAIEQMLSTYPEMREDSRKIVDGVLSAHIYSSMEPDGSPIRQALREKLDDVQDAHIRLQMLLECEMIDDPEEDFMKRLNFAFDFIDTLDSEKALQAIVKLDPLIKNMIEENPSMDVTGQSIECMTKVFSRARPHGYDPLIPLSQSVSFLGTGVAYATYVLNNLSPTMDLQTTYSMWTEAAVLSLSDERLIELGLQPHHLGWVAGRTRSKTLLDHLKQSGAGRDVVFGIDLGL